MTFVNRDQFQNYFTAGTRDERLSQLKMWHEQGLTIPFATSKHLFSIPLSKSEHIALLECTTVDQPAEFELWMFNHLLRWPQDVAATTLRVWSAQTECTLWQRLLPIARLPGLPQRLSYTILDVCPSFAGQAITNSILTTSGWEDFSSAYHALLFDRAIQFDCSSPRLDALAKLTLTQAKLQTHPDDKSLENAVTWLIRKQQTSFLDGIAQSAPTAAWKQFISIAQEQFQNRKKIAERFEKTLLKSNSNLTTAALNQVPPWIKQDLSPEVVRNLLDRAQDKAVITQVLNGCSEQTIRSLIQTFQNPSHPAFESLHFWSTGITPPSAKLKQERDILLNSQSNISQILQLDPADLGYDQSPLPCEQLMSDDELEFFKLLSQKSPDCENLTVGNFWHELCLTWSRKNPSLLGSLSVHSRKQKGLAKLAYIVTLGRIQGSDEAVLKIMDIIRSSEEDELRLIAAALGSINTPRSLQELIAMMTRPNVTPPIQQDAVAILSKCDVTSLQKELRATLQDIKVPEDLASPLAEVREAIASLVTTPDRSQSQTTTQSQVASSSSVITVNDKALDQELGNMIPQYAHLSSEVKRALRTALFFNKTISGSETTHAIDLSPLIDMQYKAMELLYREFFEEAVSQALHRGAIPRKLDVIGYARPIPPKMDEFENYIASLPTVKSIPFFSKFKLRKMLRALCQFEPGKRFTLDGLKAFGLFFLCFGRHSCRFGLSQLFSIGTQGDQELAELAKELHVFQDFRNRAAHEGFHPEASNDIQGIWRSTALIVQWAFRIHEYLQQNSGGTSTKRAS